MNAFADWFLRFLFLVFAISSAIIAVMAPWRFERGLSAHQSINRTADDIAHDPLLVGRRLKEEDAEAFNAIQRWINSGYQIQIDHAIYPRAIALLKLEAQINREDAIYWTAKVDSLRAR